MVLKMLVSTWRRPLHRLSFSPALHMLLRGADYSFRRCNSPRRHFLPGVNLSSSLNNKILVSLHCVRLVRTGLLILGAILLPGTMRYAWGYSYRAPYSGVAYFLTGAVMVSSP